MTNLVEAVSIDYDLGKHGWSKFKLSVGSASVTVGPFGYCSDALGDLVRAALMIGTYGFEAEVFFDGEPREWRLHGWSVFRSGLVELDGFSSTRP
jgi:hypothetical protein